MTTVGAMGRIGLDILKQVNECGKISRKAAAKIASGVGELLQLERELLASEKKQKSEIARLHRKLERAKDELHLAKRTIFGQSSEKMRDLEVSPGLRELVDTLAADTADADVARAGKHPSRIPPDAEIIKRDFFPDNMVCDCGENLKSIHFDSRRRFERIPERIVVIEDKFHECACGRPTCKSEVRRAKVKRFLMKGCKLENAIINEIAIQKHYEHIPVYRNWWRLFVGGHNISRQTLNRLVNRRALQFKSIAQAINAFCLSGNTLHMDETFIRVTNPKRSKNSGKSLKGTFFVMGRDESRYNPGVPRAASFSFSMSKAGAVAAELTSGSSALALHCDGNPIYDNIGSTITLQHCWAHARRYFERANDYQDSKFARSVLRAIRSIYDQEKKLWHAPAQHRLEERQRLISPMLVALKINLEDAAHVADGRLNTAINYMLARWNTLCSFLNDGRLEIDNNFIENVIRGLVITRKNSLFIGNEDAGEAWAIFYTLIETCKLNKIDPRSYFAWVTEHMEVTEGKVDPATLVPWLCPHGRFA